MWLQLGVLRQAVSKNWFLERARTAAGCTPTALHGSLPLLLRHPAQQQAISLHQRCMASMFVQRVNALTGEAEWVVVDAPGACVLMDSLPCFVIRPTPRMPAYRSCKSHTMFTNI